MGTYMHFNPDTARGYVGFVMPVDLLAELDQVRTELRLSRSQFMRQAVSAYLGQQRQSTAK
ncbi:CopG family transcriptional regulator [Bradyrhizobium sp. INPA01-394B]|uniref:CopG family transcriptional regulator n=1 Tax=Bradyrhizobium campsiandrae TaxID=1729892 RepID=A0ABR7U2F5_9BRAD|nr:ribbon-helix-helix domain-containing protein [Bradyrhizobium campsiandrae]MBC9877729.1 CopG family transcriptional regulator [Bradyrhizobium campsiandrae]MBC9977716.1 CopG family transcriptional regulator [Bradyrhizobium campsiandrae]